MCMPVLLGIDIDNRVAAVVPPSSPLAVAAKETSATPDTKLILFGMVAFVLSSLAHDQRLRGTVITVQVTASRSHNRCPVSRTNATTLALASSRSPSL